MAWWAARGPRGREAADAGCGLAGSARGPEVEAFRQRSRPGREGAEQMRPGQTCERPLKFSVAVGEGLYGAAALPSGPGGEGGCSPPRGSRRPGLGPQRRPGPAARAVDAGGGAAPCRADGEAGGRFAVCGFSQRGPRG